MKKSNQVFNIQNKQLKRISSEQSALQFHPMRIVWVVLICDTWEICLVLGICLQNIKQISHVSQIKMNRLAVYSYLTRYACWHAFFFGRLFMEPLPEKSWRHAEL